ncbi:DUF6233 domain-containing protein [Streptomyces sp. NPDC048659]|uniref:DUF6233 domain-containing protein n=1 Tax=Streptomyces sp. NPDC048659 TaxID=3155489 RepID=UPI0034430677
MLDLPDDLEQLETLELLQRIILRDILIKKEQVEKRRAAMRPVRTLPEGPGWVVAYLRERGRRVPAAVHIGDCTLAGTNAKAISAEEARRILAEGPIPGCDICRPDRELGILG